MTQYHLAYESGMTGHGLPHTEPEAIAAAIHRCTELEMAGKLLDHLTLAVVVEIHYDSRWNKYIARQPRSDKKVRHE